MFRRILFLLSFCLLLAGCSNTNRAYLDTLKLAFNQKDITASPEKIRNNKADLMAVKHGERYQVIMALPFVEGDTETWVSADKALFVMQHDVIIQTHGLDNDLVFQSNLNGNPLANADAAETSWNYITDVEGYGYGLDVKTRWRRAGDEIIHILSADFNTTVIEQQVLYTGAKPFYETDLEWVNRYWVDKQSGELLKSEQKISPANEWIRMEFLSRAQRLIDKGAM